MGEKTTIIFGLGSNDLNMMMGYPWDFMGNLLLDLLTGELAGDGVSQAYDSFVGSIDLGNV